MIEERIIFNLKIDIPELDQLEPHAKPNSPEHLGELVLESYSEFFIKVFFDEAESLDRKLMAFNPKYEYNLLSKFEVTEVVSPKRLQHINFGSYHFSGMSGGGLKEDGKAYVIIKPKGIKLVYDAVEESESEFYLNSPGFGLVELYYRYHANFPWTNTEFKFEPINNIKEHQQFNEVSFIPEHRFYTEGRSSGEHVSIEKEPRLRIKKAALTAERVKAHADLLCGLYSFYSGQTVDWKYSRIYAEGKLFVERRHVVNPPSTTIHGIFLWDFAQNPLNLILNVDGRHLLNNQELVLRLIERYNYAIAASDETKFMILYSILEHLRNYYITVGLIDQQKAGSPPKLSRVKDEYQFVHAATKTNEVIKQALREVSGIVVAEQKDQFDAEISSKVTGIKLMSMTNQFESYFSFAGIDPAKYNLDFRQLKALRDSIFHGRQVEDNEYLKKAIWYEHLPRLTGELLIKFLGIKDLKGIELRRPSSPMKSPEK